MVFKGRENPAVFWQVAQPNATDPFVEASETKM